MPNERRIPLLKNARVSKFRCACCKWCASRTTEFIDMRGYGAEMPDKFELNAVNGNLSSRAPLYSSNLVQYKYAPYSADFVAWTHLAKTTQITCAMRRTRATSTMPTLYLLCDIGRAFQGGDPPAVQCVRWRHN